MTSHPPWSEPHVEATHLTQVNCVPVRMEKGEPCIGRTANKHASDPVAAICPGVENLLIFGNDAINLILHFKSFCSSVIESNLFPILCCVAKNTRNILPQWLLSRAPKIAIRLFRRGPSCTFCHPRRPRQQYRRRLSRYYCCWHCWKL